MQKNKVRNFGTPPNHTHTHLSILFLIKANWKCAEWMGGNGDQKVERVTT